MNKLPTLVLYVIAVATLRGAEAVPEGYVMQILEPTGGKILRPEKWFYNEGHRKNAFMWTISKEDTNNGKSAYDTGFRIQVFSHILEATGQSPEDLITKIYAKQKERAQIIHKTCDASEQGLFTRICLEVTEGEHRILYSYFWSNEMDMAAVCIGGTKKENWNEYSDTFNRMGVFELIDMERFTNETDKGEHGGAGQPATRSESDSEGGDKPQPESEGLSR